MGLDYLILMLIILIPSWIVSARFNSKIKKYSKIPLNSGLSGREIAEKMLAENAIQDVKVTISSGFLTDHYNPQTRTVALSPDVYNGRSVASAAIAAHECGHAVQHANGYAPLQFRSAMVPIVSFSSRILTFVILAGILLINVFPGLMLTGIILFAVTTVFSFVTLPVEFNASARAVAWLDNTTITTSQQTEYVRDALKWAAMTYVIAALGSLVTLIYYIMIFLGRRD
jgi:Zn-dependent membrane protease YugP